METMDLDKITDIFRHRRPGFVGKHKSFSILIPLVEKDGEVHLLYEVRSPGIAQPGEVCFPGGAIEGSETPLQAAVRETMEELGIPESDIEVISKADTLQGATNFTMFCYLGVIKTDRLNINKDEVDSVFTVPISYLFENEPDMELVKVMQVPDEHFPYEKVNVPSDYPWRGGKNEIPIYECGEHPIWGLTGRITHNFVQILDGRKD